MRRFVLGDIHGAYLALKQVLESVDFDYENDKLIALGDLVDGWSQSKEVMDELMKIKNLVLIKGNHDDWAVRYYKGELNDDSKDCWLAHGGRATIKSLGDDYQTYIDFLETAKLYHIEDNKIFAHASIPRGSNLDAPINEFIFYWSRDLMDTAYISRKEKKIFDERFEDIYLGHTPVQHYDSQLSKPQIWNQVIAMDTASAFLGNLTLMNIDTKEYVQSDDCYILYPNEKGRNKFSYNENK